MIRAKLVFFDLSDGINCNGAMWFNGIDIIEILG